MAYDVKCPSCGARNVLQESQLGLSVACIKCHKDWMFDGPIRQRKAAHAADDLKRRREAAIKKARLVDTTKAIMKHPTLRHDSTVFFIVAMIVAAVGILVLSFAGSRSVSRAEFKLHEQERSMEPLAEANRNLQAILKENREAEARDTRWTP